MKGFLIASEGWRLIVTVAAAAIVILLFSDSLLLKFLMILITFGTVYLFRKTALEEARNEPGEIVSVCDGVIAQLETLECKGNIKGECFKVTIINRLIDKGVLRTPFDAEVTLFEPFRGMQLALHSRKAAFLNETGKVLFRSSQNAEDIAVVKHRLNRFNIPLAWRIERDETYQTASQYGFMLHGEVVIFLPSSSRLAVKVGDEVAAGETRIAYFTR